jgi:hypothetical protein
VEGLPETSVHRLREHPTNPNVLVAGLETGVFASFDRGAHWTTLDNNLPPVPVYDLVYQERDNALVLGTHGRGIWILDHAEPLAEITADLDGRPAICSRCPGHYRKIYAGQYWFGAGEFFAPNPPLGAVITYYLPARASDVRIALADSTGKTIRTMRGTVAGGDQSHLLGPAEGRMRTDNGVPLPGNCRRPGALGPVGDAGEL